MTDAGATPEALQSPTIANLRSQYAETKKRQAELHSELGPRHPALRQVEQQVEDLRRSIGEETNRFLQAAKNDLTRAQDYETSLNKALDVQKRQSVQMSQAAVRLRELRVRVSGVFGVGTAGKAVGEVAYAQKTGALAGDVRCLRAGAIT